MKSVLMRCLGWLACFGAIIGLSACATSSPNEHYLDAGARQHIQTVDAVLVAKQDRIGADVERNATLADLSAMAMPLTILPALLDIGVTGVRTVNANKMAKPIREKLEGHDVPSDVRQQVRQSLAGTTLDGVDEFTILRNEYPGQRAHLIADSSADAVLFIDMHYGFTANFKTLYMKSYAMLFPNHPELRQFQETPDKDRLLEFSDNIYRNQFAVALSTKLKDASAAEHAATWAEMSEEELVEVLDAAALLMADTIANDIGIDDLDSDLNLIPDGQPLNTKYDNHNRQFAKIRALDGAAENSGGQTDTDADEEPGVNARVVGEGAGS